MQPDLINTHGTNDNSKDFYYFVLVSDKTYEQFYSEQTALQGLYDKIKIILIKKQTNNPQSFEIIRNRLTEGTKNEQIPSINNNQIIFLSTDPKECTDAEEYVFDTIQLPPIKPIFREEDDGSNDWLNKTPEEILNILKNETDIKNIENRLSITSTNATSANHYSFFHTATGTTNNIFKEIKLQNWSYGWNNEYNEKETQIKIQLPCLKQIAKILKSSIDARGWTRSNLTQEAYEKLYTRLLVYLAYIKTDLYLNVNSTANTDSVKTIGKP